MLHNTEIYLLKHMLSIRITTTEEIKELIKKLKMRKAPGWDRISNILFDVLSRKKTTRTINKT